ncbi:MAG: tRNA uridine-5-carboxymethylaminomethyl(34) synthesis GTPase MnmE [Parachlamydiales bacterium]|jgi:tRNA modification GTPase
MQYNKQDTITAISTPIGEGAISIVRLSGKDALEIASKIFSKDVKKFKSHSSHFGKILDEEKNTIDTAILNIYLSPNSFTGEDIVEIQCHGGRLITQRILNITLKSGARAALPGEFSLRAFLNKKIDLIQAESIQELISAKNKYALKAAQDQLEGSLSIEIKKYQKELIEISAIIEATMDFPEEGLEFSSADELIERLTGILDQMKKLSDTFENGKAIKDGKTICIIGTPNVGKSSLMNAILKEDRAIVTEISGTTRDVLKEDLIINDMNYRLIDTAGIRDTDCVIEKEGIKRSKKEHEKADITILVLDASRSLNEDDKKLLKTIEKDKTIIALNKMDLSSHIDKINYQNTVEISAKEKKGLDNLYAMIEKLAFKANISNDEIIITKARHKTALDEAIKYLEKATDGLKKQSPYEFISLDLKETLKELSKIIGFDITEEILNSIFSKFCIGK